MLTQLHNPEKGQLRIAGLISGSGSNLRRILELEERLAQELGESPFTIGVIFSDSWDSNAAEIGRDFDKPVVIRDIDAWYKVRGWKDKKDPTMILRPEFDGETLASLAPHDCTAAAYAGYMSAASPLLVRSFLGINVHPADLRIMDGDKRKYTGDFAVRDAILAGETELRSTIHLVTDKIDYGPILRVSTPVPVELPENWDPENADLAKRIAKEHQERLKEIGDWKIFPQAILDIAEGRYLQDTAGRIYYARAIPHGLVGK